MAAIIVGKLNERFGTSLRTVDLLLNPTIKDLARKVVTGENSIMERIDLVQELKKYPVEEM